MHCFICVTYMIILTSANPTVTQELTKTKQRSLFRDVIESLRLHAQLPDVINRNEDNNLAQNYDRFEYDNEAELTNSDYLPRRNDRLEMPGLKYRIPKDLKHNLNESNKEIVVYINTESTIKKVTEKPKTTVKAKKPVDANDYYITNKMAGQSQIGDRKTETVIRPMIVVNIKGIPDNNISEDNANRTDADPTRNYFNIRQEINLERGKSEPKINQEVSMADDKSKHENTLLCDNSFDAKGTEKRKFNGILEILLSIN